jgi:hypothetical protein
MAQGDQIDDSNYNTLQDKVQLLLGTGTGSRGYGQVLQTADVFAGNVVTAAQWTALRNDILSVRVHQDGNPPPALISITKGAPVDFGIIPNFDNILTAADFNRFSIAAGQSTVSQKASQNTSATWSAQAQATLTVTFGTSDIGRYFFNSGGKIRILATRTGGSTSAQNNAWTNFLANTGIVPFGAVNIGTVNYYNLTDVYQVYYQGSLSTPYTANYFRLEAKTDVADNSNGTATQLDIRITLKDDYVDPDVPAGYPAGTNPPSGTVDGTLSFVVEELKASGSLYPSGTWNITSGSYSLSAISTS